MIGVIGFIRALRDEGLCSSDRACILRGRSRDRPASVHGLRGVGGRVSAGGADNPRAGRVGRADVIALSQIVRRLLGRPSALAAMAAQLRIRLCELLAACPAGGRGRPVESRHGHAKARTRQLNRVRSAISSPATEIRDRHVAEAEDRLRALGSAMRDDGDAAAQANRRDRSSDRRPFRMGGDASDDPQHALAQR